jgi:MerR family transcriptional regulator, light-induced transcriptional regulator
MGQADTHGQEGAPLSVGELAEATGVSVDALRAWERRYGRPVPRRLASGHRRYDPAQVRLVRGVVEGLARGWRLRDLMRAQEAELLALLDEPDPRAEGWEPRRVLELAREWKADAILAALRDSHERLGARGFSDQRLAPLFRSVGAAWAAGRVAPRHEHFLTELVEDLLRSLRLQHALPEDAPVIVLATLEGERHALGLQLAALVTAARGLRPLLLGASLPLGEVAAAARESHARGVAVGVSPATAGARTDRALAALRRLLPARTALLVGGSRARGVRRGPRGVDYLGPTGFSAFESWLVALR